MCSDVFECSCFQYLLYIMHLGCRDKLNEILMQGNVLNVCCILTLELSKIGYFVTEIPSSLGRKHFRNCFWQSYWQPEHVLLDRLFCTTCHLYVNK